MIKTTLTTISQKGKVTRLPTEALSENTKFRPVLVTNVSSPELFCVTLLNKRHVAVLNVS